MAASAPGDPEDDDVEAILERALAPDERIVWLAAPDRALWRRLVATGLGCLPFVALVLLVAAGTVIASWSTASGAFTRTLDAGRAVPAFLGALLLVIMLYPIVADELARRERRYVVTSARALVLVPGRVEHELPLAQVSGVALHSGLFDDKPSGVELRRQDGSAGIVFRDMEEPEATRAALEQALAAARSEKP